MPVPGLSLVGFMEKKQAVEYLQSLCVHPRGSVTDLEKCWNLAKGRVRVNDTQPRAGKPVMYPLPNGHEAHLNQLLAHPQLREVIGQAKEAQFALVEIDPLLCIQFHVQTEHAQKVCVCVGVNPDCAAMLPVCLPTTVDSHSHNFEPTANGLVIRSASLNYRALERAQVAQAHLHLAGVACGPAPPFVTVAKIGERHYLINGYHRAFALRSAGAQYMPCLLTEFHDFSQIGIVQQGYFAKQLLESAHPPTIGHFFDSRPYPVTLRTVGRVIEILWQERVEYLD